MDYLYHFLGCFRNMRKSMKLKGLDDFSFFNNKLQTFLTNFKLILTNMLKSVMINILNKQFKSAKQSIFIYKELAKVFLCETRLSRKQGGLPELTRILYQHCCILFSFYYNLELSTEALKDLENLFIQKETSINWKIQRSEQQKITSQGITELVRLLSKLVNKSEKVVDVLMKEKFIDLLVDDISSALVSNKDVINLQNSFQSPLFSFNSDSSKENKGNKIASVISPNFLSQHFSSSSNTIDDKLTVSKNKNFFNLLKSSLLLEKKKDLPVLKPLEQRQNLTRKILENRKLFVKKSNKIEEEFNANLSNNKNFTSINQNFLDHKSLTVQEPRLSNGNSEIQSNQIDLQLRIKETSQGKNKKDLNLSKFKIISREKFFAGKKITKENRAPEVAEHE